MEERWQIALLGDGFAYVQQSFQLPPRVVGRSGYRFLRRDYGIGHLGRIAPVAEAAQLPIRRDLLPHNTQEKGLISYTVWATDTPFSALQTLGTGVR